MTAFLRSNRGIESDIHDTFTLVLQYSGSQKDLLVTIKTSVVSVMKDQLRFSVHGTKGTFLKVRSSLHSRRSLFRFTLANAYSCFQFGCCPQEERAIAAPGQPADDPNYGQEDERIWGTLTTKDTAFAASCQTRDDATGFYIGKYPSLPGYYRGYYENLVDAIRGTVEIAVKPETSRDGIRLIELARKSHISGATVPWSESD